MHLVHVKFPSRAQQLYVVAELLPAGGADVVGNGGVV